MIDQKSADVQMIERALDWPQWPYLPVKRWDGTDMACGVIVSGRFDRVYEVNMWDANRATLAAAKKHDYETVEDLIDAGWRVD